MRPTPSNGDTYFSKQALFGGGGGAGGRMGGGGGKQG